MEHHIRTDAQPQLKPMSTQIQADLPIRSKQKNMESP